MRKSTVVRLSAAVLVGGALFTAYTQFGNQPAKLDTIKVKDDLYVIHNNVVPGNTTALVTNDGVLLVDDKFDVDHAGIMAELKKITDKPVKYVINTHHHADHSGGNAKFQAMDAKVVASQEAREQMVVSNQPGLPDIVIEHHAHIFLGGKNVALYHFGRAHTNGDVVVLFLADRVLAAGDMYTKGDDVPQLIDYGGGGSGVEWPNTLRSALQLDFDTVVPGHGPMATKQEMAAFRDSTIRLVSRVREMNRAKKSKDEIAKMLGTEFHWTQLHFSRGLDGVIAEAQ
jgi:glyoxylase-like metal-dependent hydrolase (beta-lactamase superfamily II)